MKALPGLGMIIASDPQVTIDREGLTGKPLRYCVDADTEKKLQRQRLLGAFVVSPTIMYAGWKYPGNFLIKTFIIGVGGACFWTNLSAFAAVKKAERNQ